MNTPAQLVILLLLLNTCALPAAGNMNLLLRLAAAQGILTALVLPLLPTGLDWARALLFSLAVLGIKGLCFPWLLGRISRRWTAPAEPRFSRNISMPAILLALIFALWLETRLPPTPVVFPFLLFPAAFCAIFAGLALVAGRMHAIAQVIGCLAVENGIFLLGTPLMSPDGFWIEMLVLLAALGAVCVMGITADHMGKAFESIDVRRLRILKD